MKILLRAFLSLLRAFSSLLRAVLEELEVVRGSALLYVMSLARPLSTRGYRCCTIPCMYYTDNSVKERVYGTS